MPKSDIIGEDAPALLLMITGDANECGIPVKLYLGVDATALLLMITDYANPWRAAWAELCEHCFYDRSSAKKMTRKERSI